MPFLQGKTASPACCPSLVSCKVPRRSKGPAAFPECPLGSARTHAKGPPSCGQPLSCAWCPAGYSVSQLSSLRALSNPSPLGKSRNFPGSTSSLRPPHSEVYPPPPASDLRSPYAQVPGNLLCPRLKIARWKQGSHMLDQCTPGSLSPSSRSHLLQSGPHGSR